LRVRLGRWLMGLYVLWMATSDRHICRRGGRPWEWLRRGPLGIWKGFRSYFRANVVYDFDEDEAVFQDGPHIMGSHPHGIVSLSTWANIVFHKLVPLDYRIATIAQNFLIPFWRDLLLGLGFVDASRETLASLLRKGLSVAIVVGGAEEALDSRPGTNDLTLGTRLGFVRLALEHGAALVPIFSFGENELFHQVAPNPPGSLLRELQQKGKDHLGFSMPLVVGRWGLPFPFRERLTTVVGRPLLVAKVEHPSLEDVLAVHSEYVRRLQDLYDRYVERYAPDAGGLVLRDSKL